MFRNNFSFLRFVRNKHLGPKRKYPVDQTGVDKLPIFDYTSSNRKAKKRLYVWGRGEAGALGMGLTKQSHILKSVKHPSRHHFGEVNTITDVSSGFGFTLFAVESNDDKKVYGCGINNCSQIGYQSMKPGHPMAFIIYPKEIRLPYKFPTETEVQRVSAGRSHSLILTDEGLFTFGNNAYGQCGRKIVENEKYLGNHVVTNIPDLNGKKIVDIQCGQDHSIALTKSGEVYTCGWGADGQTGLQHFNSEDSFTQVAADIQGERIVKVASSADCVLAINEKGDVFGWGNSEYGQLPYKNDIQQVHTPRNLTVCRNYGKIIDIATGGSFCMILNEKGDVYVWGFGLLGLGPQVQQLTKPTLVPPTLFGRNELNPDNRVVSINCGVNHMSAINDGGDLFMWGRNRGGCLGLGHEKDQYFPFKASVSASVCKVSCGFDHTVALCEAFVGK